VIPFGQKMTGRYWRVSGPIVRITSTLNEGTSWLRIQTAKINLIYLPSVIVQFS
jgi:hypothetical protein